MLALLHLGSFALYGVAGALLGVSFAREARRLAGVATVVVVAALVVHAIALADYASIWNQLPLDGLGPGLSSLAFLIALGTVLAVTLGHAATVGLVLVPVVALLTGVAAIVGLEPSAGVTSFRGGWFVLHILFAFLGYAGLTVAFAAGLMYILQFRELKSKHFGAVFRFFPPLETLDRLGRQGVIIGFPFLTLAIVLGWAWTATYETMAMPALTKLFWAFLSWVVLLTALFARAGTGEKGERGAVVSGVGFLLVVVVYVVVRAQMSRQGAFL